MKNNLINPWSHLPNAAHIDRVLGSLKSHPKVWKAAWGATYYAAHDAARDAAWDAARDAARDAAAWSASAAAAAVRDATLDEVRGAAWDAILALIAYDDAVKYLDMPSDKLKMWAILSEDTAAILLLPAVIAFEQIGELELA